MIEYEYMCYLQIQRENIHLNSYMFELLIDMSVWRLKELYQDTETMHIYEYIS